MTINLIQLFTFYLASMFLIGTFRRVRQYHDIVQLALSFPNRWPKTLKQIRQHGTLFFTWATFRPALLALTLMLVQFVCSRIIWPQANITPNDLLGEWWMLPFVIATATGMILVDLYGVVFVGTMNRLETERYLDEAEHWLGSWKAPLISTLTLGFLNPRRIVDTEVQKALIEGGSLIRRSLWWVSMQAGLRIVYGLTLWIAWATLPVPQPETEQAQAIVASFTK
jgi:hypothetical protein